MDGEFMTGDGVWLELKLDGIEGGEQIGTANGEYIRRDGTGPGELLDDLTDMSHVFPEFEPPTAGWCVSGLLVWCLSSLGSG